MNKKIIFILGAVVALLGILTIIFMSNFFKKPNQTNTKEDIIIQLINPVDKRTLTKQGEKLLIDLVKNGSYSTEVVNTEYSDWQSIIEKSIRLNVIDNNTGYSFIIPSNVAHWEEGRAYKFIPADMTQRSDLKVNIIYFNTFKLENFLSMDPNTITPVTDMKDRVSYTVQFEGNGVEFSLIVNNKEVSIGSNIATQGSAKILGSTETHFSTSIPINKYLKIGTNEVLITYLKQSNDAHLTIKLFDQNSPSGIIREGEADLSSKGTILDFSLPNDVEIEKQISIFD